MGQVTLGVWAGGGVVLQPSGATELRWWFNRRVQTIRATASGFVMTIQDANKFPMPWGPMVLVIINPKTTVAEPNTATFTLRDLTPTFSFTVGVGKAVWVSRIKGAGGATWWPMLRTIK